jgi:uncharacterized protein (DUF433 family)
MSEHFTLRFPAATSERLERRARAAGAKPRTLAARYVEEGIRRDDHPLVRFVDGPSGRRAALTGTQLDVWEVIATLRDNHNDIGATAEYLHVPPGLVEAVVTYYGEFRDEIDEEIAVNLAESERAHAAWQAGRQALAE